jgi:hypothetical protein
MKYFTNGKKKLTPMNTSPCTGKYNPSQRYKKEISLKKNKFGNYHNKLLKYL